jgi:hypothetical protein
LPARRIGRARLPGRAPGVDRRGVEVGAVGVDDAPLGGAWCGIGGHQLVDQRLDVGSRFLAQQVERAKALYSAGIGLLRTHLPLT